MKIKLLKSLLVAGAFLCFGYVQAQTVTGTVSDASGPLAGASVVEKGTTNGTVTDFDGNYTLTVSGDATLIFSYIGYKAKEIAVNNQSSINITLEEDATELEGAVVIGYGTTTVKDATGAVTAVTAEDFNKGVISSPEQLIQGKSAGVQITQSSGQPGAGISLRIRGTGSVRANNSPLFVIDGVPVSNEGVSAAGADIGGGTLGESSNGAQNPLNFLNPNDIESMSILKDASATAIYGSRGANGVVVITTKSGKSGGEKGQWNFSSNVTIANAAKYDLLTAREFIARGGTDFGGSTNWQDFTFNTTASVDNNLSYAVNYGSGNVRATLGYGDQQGVIRNTELERITGRVNVNQFLFDDKLKIGFQGTISRINDRSPFLNRSADNAGDLVSATYLSNPTIPVDPNINRQDVRNPANLLAYYDDRTNTNRFLGNLSLNYDITDALSAKVNLGLDTSTSERGQIAGPQIINLGNGAENNGRAALSNLDTESKLLELTLNYKKEFESSKLDALVGFSYQDFNRKGQNILGQGYNSSDLNEIRDITVDAYNATKNLVGNAQGYGIGIITNGAVDDNENPIEEFRVLNLFPEISTTNLPVPSIPVNALSVDTFDNTDELQSYFGRVNYTIQDKYLFTATLRVDGSSRFGGNNQYGYFPSAAFAWKLSEEDFIDKETFSTLKMRINWGVTGNQDGVGYGNFITRTRWSALNIQPSSELTQPQNGALTDQNEDLKWEETAQYGLGIDFGFNNDRLTGSLDFYRKETTDILLNTPSLQPSISQFNFGNVDGTILNQGVELGIDYDIIKADDYEGLNWYAGFNIAYNNNKLTNYDGADLQAGTIYGPGASGATTQVLTNGKSLFTYNLRLVDEDLNVETNPTVLDKSGLPDITTGLSTGISYKQWNASVFFSGQFGHYVYNNTENVLFSNTDVSGTNTLKRVADGIAPKDLNPSTFFLEKGDFVRLQSASVSYNLPLNDTSVLKSFRLSLSGQNLFLITGYSGLDPEVSTSNIPAGGNGLPSASIDYLSYPRPRTYTLGVNVTF